MHAVNLQENCTSYKLMFTSLVPPSPSKKKIKKLRPHLPTKTINLSLITIHINAAILKSLWLNCGIYKKQRNTFYRNGSEKCQYKKIKKTFNTLQEKISTQENYFQLPLGRATTQILCSFSNSHPPMKTLHRFLSGSGTS